MIRSTIIWNKRLSRYIYWRSCFTTAWFTSDDTREVCFPLVYNTLVQICCVKTFLHVCRAKHLASNQPRCWFTKIYNDHVNTKYVSATTPEKTSKWHLWGYLDSSKKLNKQIYCDYINYCTITYCYVWSKNCSLWFFRDSALYFRFQNLLVNEAYILSIYSCLFSFAWHLSLEYVIIL